jgi:hypothetical protein
MELAETAAEGLPAHCLRLPSSVRKHSQPGQFLPEPELLRVEGDA